MHCSTAEIVLYVAGGFVLGIGVAVLWAVSLVRCLGPGGRSANRR